MAVRTTTRKVRVLELNEKAVSKKQQRFFGMVRAAQKGEGAASPEVAKVAGEISKKDAKDFAKTKHKGLPEKKKMKEHQELIDEKAVGAVVKQLARIGAKRLSSKSTKKAIYKTAKKVGQAGLEGAVRGAEDRAREAGHDTARNVGKKKVDEAVVTGTALATAAILGATSAGAEHATKKALEKKKAEAAKKKAEADLTKELKKESFEIDKSAHKKAQKKAKLRNLAKGNTNPNEKAAAQKKAGGPKLVGEGKTFDAWKKAAANALKRKKEERKAQPATDAGARARRKLKDKEHNKYVNFLHADDD